MIVIGAGAAGLSAAYALRKQGVDHLVLEAADHAGGRIAAQEVEGFRIDTGAQVFTAACGTAVRLCHELGVPVRECSRRAGVYSHGRFRVLDQHDPWVNLRTVLGFRLLSPRGLWQSIRLALRLHACAASLSFDDPSKALALDTDADIADWIRAHGGPEFLEEMGHTIVSLLTLARPEEVGAAYGMTLLWGFVFERTNFLTPGGGMGSLTRALVDAVADRLRLSTPAQQVVLRNGRVTGVQTNDGFIAADSVICATTATTARRLLPDLPADIDRALESVTYSSTCRMVFGVQRPTLPDRCYSLSLPSREGTFLVGYSDAAVKSPGVAPTGAGLIHAESTSEQAGPLSALSDGDVRSRMLKEIRRYTPDMPEPLFTRVYRWKQAVCLMPGGSLRSLDRVRRSLPTRVPGLALAGEYMSIPSVNGALASGIAAVEDLLRGAPHETTGA